MDVTNQMLQRIGTVASVMAISVVSIAGFAQTQASRTQAPKASAQTYSAGNLSSVVSNLAPDPVANVFVDGQRIEVPSDGTVMVSGSNGATSTVSHTEVESGAATTTVKNEAPSNSVSVSVTTDDAGKAISNNFTNFQSTSFGSSFESNNHFIYSTGGLNITNSN